MADAEPAPSSDDEAAALIGHSDRIGELLDALERQGPSSTWQQVEELVQRLTALYGAGLWRALERLRAAGLLDERAERRLYDDELVASLLLLHGLHEEQGAVGGVLPPARTAGDESTREPQALVQLRRKARPLLATAPAHDDETRCELCAAPVGAAHAHVVDLEERALLCACKPCSLLFERQQDGRYRTVPRRVLVQPSLALTSSRLAALGVPVQLAFLFKSSRHEQWTAVYPSPAGPTESALRSADVEQLGETCALVRALAPDTEALLVYGRRAQVVLECFLAPIDDCYQLVGRIRRAWRGFDGGDDARRDIEAFFTSLRARAKPCPDERGASS